MHLLVSSLLLAISGGGCVAAFSPPSVVLSRSRQPVTAFRTHTHAFPRKRATLNAAPPPGGVAVDEPASTPDVASESVPFQNRGKVNEIDFCMAPSDVSLSRSYAGASADNAAADTNANASAGGALGGESGPRVLSLTRALNSVSNRAVRRILLSRSWPSAEALNLSLRQVLASADKSGDTTSLDAENDVQAAASTSSPKCPVPRPVLNIIMRRQDDGGTSIAGKDKAVVRGTESGDMPMPRSKRGRTDEEWVAEQMEAFRVSYGALPGYQFADAYLECILSLATSGVESPRVSEVFAAGVYDEPYRRVISVLKSVGAVFEDVPASDPPRTQIASRLVDKDICLSMIDKLSINKERTSGTKLAPAMSKEKDGDKVTGALSIDEDTTDEGEQETATPSAASAVQVEVKGKPEKGIKKLLFWRKKNGGAKESGGKAIVSHKDGSQKDDSSARVFDHDKTNELTPEDLGAVLLSAEEPTMTRQLNILSNIVQRALLFGGDQELLVLSETLEADKPAFIQRWYPNTEKGIDGERRPGVQYFSCLVQLLKKCYTEGVLTNLDLPLPLSQSYVNAYERLTASCIELGSGYIKPIRAKEVLPKTAKEELGRFARWETSIRKTSPDVSSYPDDLVGTWQVKDEVGGKTIGVSNVVFKLHGEVEVAPPLQGLRWRLDPGPTHLDTCTFQVLSDDGAILQYRGFVDRGARLEARFSKRSIKIRGAVTFQMRDGDALLFGDEYQKDMLPINYQTGTTRFVMTKIFDVAT